MNKIILIILLTISTLSHAQNDEDIVKSALGFNNELSGALIELDILHSKRIADNYYAFVFIEQYTNGGCAPRGSCGCGVDRSYISLSLNKSEKVKSKEVRVYSCGTILDSNVVEERNTTAIFVDELQKSCSSATKNTGMSFYSYNKDNPEKGIQDISLKEYEKLTKRSVVLVNNNDITKDKCFYHNYLLISEGWGGAYESQLVFKKLVNGRAGEFVGYKRKGIFIPDSDSNIKPPRSKQIVGIISKKVQSKQKLLKMALSHFKNMEYRKAEDFYQKAISSYRGEIYKKNISVLNDLSLTLYKQKKYDASESWSEYLLKLKNADNYKRHAAAANYNLGLVSEKRNNVKKALAYYKDSYALRNTSSAKKAIKRLE